MKPPPADVQRMLTQTQARPVGELVVDDRGTSLTYGIWYLPEHAPLPLFLYLLCTDETTADTSEVDKRIRQLALASATHHFMNREEPGYVWTVQVHAICRPRSSEIERITLSRESAAEYNRKVLAYLGELHWWNPEQHLGPVKVK